MPEGSIAKVEDRRERSQRKYPDFPQKIIISQVDLPAGAGFFLLESKDRSILETLAWFGTYFSMAKAKKQLTWCIVRLGEDLNWWVDEISDEVHWDIDGLSIIDPRQLGYIIDLIEPLNDDGFDSNLLESAFFAFRIEKDLGKGRVRLARSNDTLLDTEDQLFAMPNLIDEETGPYADFIDHITKLRVKLLNDTIDFEQKLTMDEIEEEIREDQNNSFIEGSAVHIFNEIVNILEYVPAGYEAEEEEVAPEAKDEDIDVEVSDDLPEIDEKEEQELQKDESLRWDGDDEESEDMEELDDDEEEEEDLDDLEGDDDLDDLEDDEEAVKSRIRKK